MARNLGCLFAILVLVVAAFIFGRDYVRRHPQNVPWTALDLEHPVGFFTSTKIVRLGGETAQCRALLANAGTGDGQAPARSGEGGCGYDDGVRLAAAEGSRPFDYRPAPLVTSCPVAAALFLWEAQIVQPAALRHLGSSVTAVRHAGSYSCRNIYGRDSGSLSEHATADAVDIIGFELADGGRVSVLDQWQAGDARAAFLKEVRDGACRIFSTVLSPDYNEAHRDHLHFDVASRGGGTWTLCR